MKEHEWKVGQKVALKEVPRYNAGFSNPSAKQGDIFTVEKINNNYILLNPEYGVSWPGSSHGARTLHCTSSVAKKFLLISEVDFIVVDFIVTTPKNPCPKCGADDFYFSPFSGPSCSNKACS